MNFKTLLRQWENEEIELEKSLFPNVSSLASFIIYGWNALDPSEFELLIEDLDHLTT